MIADPPRIDRRNIPADERTDAFNCESRLQEIKSYHADFLSAVRLFNFSRAHEQMWSSSPHDGLRRDFQAWLFIAARDGAMSIFHFAKAIDGANTWASRSKTLSAAIDRTALKDSFKLVRQYFPRFEAITRTTTFNAS